MLYKQNGINLTTLLSVWFCVFYSLCIFSTNAATTSGVNVMTRFPRRLQQKQSGYLPPFSTRNNDENSQNLQNIEQFQTSPQITTHKSIIQHYKSYTSYEPPASGAAPFQFSMPQAPQLQPLPTLLPKSVIGQLTTPLPLSLMNLSQQNQQIHQQHILQPEVPTLDGPVLMVEEPTSMFLTSNHNKTLEAAKILASTLLEANNEATFEQQQRDILQPPEQLNSTDVLVVKSQKKAYVIPTHLAKNVRNLAVARELYEMRDKLDKAFTINQFIFIIKPDKINFLNKLV